MAGIITLINVVLTALPLFYLSFFRARTVVINRLTAIQRHFLWGGNLDQTPVCNILNQTPVYNILKQTPLYNILNQTPVYNILKQTVVYNILNETTVYTY